MIKCKGALKIIIENTHPLSSILSPLTDSAGLRLAKAVNALWDMPRWDNSSMDGYAISDVAAKKFKIVGASFAGHPFLNTMNNNEAVQITTGAEIPNGAIAVIPLEMIDKRKGCISIHSEPIAGQYIRHKGCEFRLGEELLPVGSILNAAEISLLASAGIKQVQVTPKPKVAVFSTGDELVEFGSDPDSRQIINSSMQFLITRLRELGCTPIPLGTAKDENSQIKELIVKAQEADLIVSTGGVSVGEKDLVHKILQKNGFIRKFWKVSIKPGKPLLFGTINNIPCFGLPGNPSSTAATFEIFVQTAIQVLSSHPKPQPNKIVAYLTAEVRSEGNRDKLIWGKTETSNGTIHFKPANYQSSNQTKAFQGADAILPVPSHVDSFSAGEKVEVILLRNH